jgi:hypothetical protein
MRSRAVLLFLVVALLSGGLVACQGANPANPSNPANPTDARVSPLPPGFAEKPPGESEEASRHDADDLDRLLAVVEGRPITLRRLVRETGGRAPGLEEAPFERQLQKRLREVVREELFVREAQRAGIQVPPQRLDETVAESRDAMMKEASEAEGRPVSFPEILEQRGMTEAEFRETLRRQVLYRIFLRKVLHGVAGIKPQVDMEVSPAEVRRIYREYPGAFDEKRGIQFAAFRFLIDPLVTAGRTYPEAEAEVRRLGEDLAAGLRRGEAPGPLATRFGLTEGQWRAFQDGFVEDVPPAAVGPEARAWLIAEERVAREAALFEVPEGTLVVGVLAVRPHRVRPWEEAREEIVRVIQTGRSIRVESGLLIEMLSRPDAVWPQELADSMAADARELLRRLEEEPVLGAVRFQ